MITRIRLFILAFTAVLYSVPAWSLGLGDARVQSFIGQPLELHIDLLTSPGDDLESVTARLASAEDFALIGASREAISVPLAFQVRSGDASPGAYILVTSRLAVSNPVLRLVVEVNWSSGRLLREYTVFLDPPTVPSQAPAPVASQSRPQQAEPEISQPDAMQAEVAEAAPVAQERAPEPVVSNEPAPSTTPVAETSETVADAVSEPESRDGGRYGPIRDGQTLWSIANDHMGGAGFDMSQVMVAIQRKNPNAFVNGNINLLMRGATLDLPSSAEVAELSSAEARELVAQQEAAFRMRSSLASTSTPLLASESVSDGNEQAESNLDSQFETAFEEDEPVVEDPVARLEIVPASDEDLAAADTATGAVPGGEGADEVSANVREELARTEEALISAQQENAYLQDRIAELEAQIGDSDGQASDGLVADDELADLEERLQAERLAAKDEAEMAADRTENPVPQVVTSEPEKPWYSGPMIWIIMIIIVVSAVVGWLFNRRRAAEHYETEDAQAAVAVSGLKDEAQDILRALDSDDVPDEPPHEDEGDDQTESPADEVPADEGDDDSWDVTDDSEDEKAGEEDLADEDEAEDASIEEEADDEPPELDIRTVAVQPEKSDRGYDDDHGDAKVLDENSSDPEIQLDLARAYISMGDKEAARAILDEVLSLGNEDQKSEARAMMDKI